MSQADPVRLSVDGAVATLTPTKCEGGRMANVTIVEVF